MKDKFNWPEKLYVIGNGFDYHHNIHCGYDSFKKWLIDERIDEKRGDGF